MYNQNSGYGQALFNAVHQAVPTFGRIFIVLDPDDTDEENYQRMQEVFRTDPNGRVRFFTSLSDAYDAAESNNNDVIIFDGNSTHVLTAELNVTKDRVHFVGLDYLMGIHRKQGQSSKITIGVTTATGDVGAIINTGVRNSFRGLKITSTNTLTQALYAFMDGGEYTYMEDCEVAMLSKLTTATCADFACNSDTGMYVNCSFGTTVNEITANGTRPNVLVSGEAVASGKKLRDVRFVDCDFLYKCGDTDNRFVYGANATDVERMLSFENCKFINNVLSAQTPGVAVDFGAAQTEGAVFLDSRCAVVDVTVMAATGETIYVMAPSSPTYATSGLSVAS
jgi:hypothetical protein